VDHESAQGVGAFNCPLKQVPIVITFWPTQLSNDPSLSSLPLLTTFLKAYSRPYLGLTPPQFSKTTTNGDSTTKGTEDTEGVTPETEELIEKDIRDRFKKMCEGYFQNVSKKLAIEHSVRGIKATLACITHAWSSSDCKNRIVGTMKHTFDPGRSSRTVSKLTRK